MARINLYELAPEAYKALQGLEKFIANSPLDRKLYELVKMRASQINGCHYCLNMHSRDAMKAGETAQRLFLLDAWRETELYSEKERAALALTEAMTKIADHHVPQNIYDEAARHFSKEEFAALIMGVVAINSWNRLAITAESDLD